MSLITRGSIPMIAALLTIGAGAAFAYGPDDDRRPPPIDLPGPLTGAIEITNERDRSVQIYIDGRFAIELRPRSTDTVERVPNGTRLVSYDAPRDDGARWQTDRVEVREGRRSSLRIAPLRGQVAVVNRAGIEMHVLLGDVDLGTLQPGREIVMPPMPAGRYVLSAAPHGWRRAKPQVQDVLVVPGEIVRAEIRSFAATLVVSNPFMRGVTVWVDGRRVTRLDRLQSERIVDLEPGPARVEIRADGRVLAAEMLDLLPGRETYFAPKTRYEPDVDIPVRPRPR